MLMLLVILALSGSPSLVKARPGHVPVMATYLGTCSPEPGEFRLSSPALIRDNQLLVNIGSMAVATEPDPATALYAPGLGRFVFSSVPFQGAIEGKLQFSKISFTLEGRSYLLLTGAPISSSGRGVWVLHQPEWRPTSLGRLNASEPMVEASSLQVLLGGK